MREQLVGYLLGALDALEQAELEAKLAEDPALRRELEEVRASLAPLDDDEDPVPPPDLAARTCRHVRSYAGWFEPSLASGNWRLQDLCVAAGVFLAASMLVFPAISNSLSTARRTQCQNNLRAIGMSLFNYAEHWGSAPYVPTQGKLSVAGAMVPTLLSGGFLPGEESLRCPEVGRADGCPPIPLPHQIQAIQCPVELAELHRRLGGDYGWHVGYIDAQGRYHPTVYRGRTWFALVADRPDHHVRIGSSNHGGRGRNVLFEGGNVTFLVTRLAAQRDDIYTSDDGTLGAGHGENDAVILDGSTPPLPRSR
jgi:hypothetical protein